MTLEITLEIVDIATAQDRCKNVPNHDAQLRARMDAQRAANRPQAVAKAPQSGDADLVAFIIAKPLTDGAH